MLCNVPICLLHSPMQLPLFEVTIQLEDDGGRMDQWPLSPLHITAMSIAINSRMNPAVVQALQYILLPGVWANAAALPAIECTYQRFEKAANNGEGSTHRCDDMNEATKRDVLLRASNVSNFVEAFHRLIPERTFLMAGSTCACLFIPLCMLISAPMVPIGSIIMAVYGAFKGGLTMLLGQLFVINLLAVAYVLIMPEAPRRKPGVKAKTS